MHLNQVIKNNEKVKNLLSHPSSSIIKSEHSPKKYYILQLSLKGHKMNNKTQLLILLTGLVLIGILFYLVNFTQPTSTQNKQESKQIQKSTSQESVETTVATSKDTTPQTKTPSADTTTKATPAYKEVFKETLAPKTDIERITEREVIAKLDEQSDALIKEADARIEAKNLKVETEPLSPEKIDALQQKAEVLQNKIDK